MMTSGHVEWHNHISATVEEYCVIKDTISKECRWYIIGKYCERERLNHRGKETREALFMRLGQSFGCSEPTVRRFISYGKAIDHLHAVAPDIVDDIVSGNLIISIENLRSLVKRPHMEMYRTVARIKSGKERIHEIFPERAIKLKKSAIDRKQKASLVSTVKDTPKYDPDAQVMGLTYTIPSWITAIERIFMSAHICDVTKHARNKLIKELSALENATDLMLELLSEESTERGSHETS
jgi:hypothetical protein